jgi:two-component system, OmpR family, heavy metal sensor histidine kinase CusS
MSRKSITRRLALMFGLVSSVGFLGLGLNLSSAIETHFETLDRKTLESAVLRVEHALKTADGPDDLVGLHARLDSMMIGHDRVSLWVASGTGEPLAADSEIAFPTEQTEAAFAQAAIGRSVLFTWEQAGHLYRGMASRLSANNPTQAALKVAAALNIDHHAHFGSIFLGALWASVAGAIIVSVLLGIFVVRRGMKPLRLLAEHVGEISSSQLNQRLSTNQLPVELIEVAEAFNAMLARLDASFRRLSEFSADIAHELRTPVSNLLTQTQVMLSRNRSEEEYRDVLASNAEELERLSRMVSDMLFLAKTDNGPAIVARESVDLASEVRDLFEFYEALASENAIALSLKGALTVDGDRLMLRRAINNLLANAIRYTSQDNTVRVRLERVGDRGIISVTNPGIPIPDTVRERLFERLYRADTARLRDTDGTGLGLAIVAAIAEAHGGGVSVESAPNSNTFSVWLPLHANESEDVPGNE